MIGPIPAPAVSVEPTVPSVAIDPRTGRRLPAFVTFVLLYLAALILPLMHLSSRPAFDYNWEAYTTGDLVNFIANPTTDVLKINQGLMTTSGDSAPVVGPMWVTASTFGLSFGSMRLAMVLLATLAVPLTWLWGRFLYSDAVGLGAAVLVGTSQVFLLYARTATSVGVSLFPAVLTFLVLWMVVRPEARRWWAWLIVLQLCLVANGYFYSPIRFLWPIALVLFAAELVFRSGQRRRFLLALVVTAACLPLVLPYLMEGPSQTIREAVTNYYKARAEQVVSMSESRDYLISFVQVHTGKTPEQLADESTGELIQQLIQINLEDLGKILIDQDTRPAITDYWNPSGRLYDRVLVPFVALGALILLVRVFRSARSRYLLALAAGFSLPMVGTTNVHIGRLVFLVPIVAVLAMIPMQTVIDWLRRRPKIGKRQRILTGLATVTCLAVAVLGAVPSLHDWFDTGFPPSRSAVVDTAMMNALRSGDHPQIAYVFGPDREWEVEQLRVATLMLMQDGTTSYVDVTTGVVLGDGPILVFYHGMLDRLSEPDLIPGYCTNFYVVDNGYEQAFLDVTSADAMAKCGKPLDYSAP